MLDPKKYTHTAEDRATMLDLLARHNNLPDLCVDLSQRLRTLLPFEFFIVSLHDVEKNTMNVRVWRMDQDAPPPLEVEASACPSSWCMEHQRVFIAPNNAFASDYPVCQEVMQGKGVKSYCLWPINGITRPLGILGVGSDATAAFSEADAQLLRDYTAPITVGIERLVAQDTLDHERGRLQMMLDVSKALSTTTNIAEAFSAIAAAIRNVLSPDLISLAVGDEASKSFCIYGIQSPIVDKIVPSGTSVPFEESLAYPAFSSGRTKVLYLDEMRKIQGTHVPVLIKEGISAICSIPLMVGVTKLGALNLGSCDPNAFPSRRIEILEQIAAQIAMALDRNRAQAKVESLQSEKQRLKALMDVGSALSTTQQVRDAFPQVAKTIRELMQPDSVGLSLYDKASHSFSIHSLDFDWADDITGTKVPFHQSLSGAAFGRGDAAIFTLDDLQAIDSPAIRYKLERGIRTACAIPIIHGEVKLGALVLCSRTTDAFRPTDIAMLKQIAMQVAATLDYERTEGNLLQLTKKLKKEKIAELPEVRTNPDFTEIIGESPSLKRILSQVATVAPTDAAVLILGETGTGKELIARAVHKMSARSAGAFIKLNCAAIPTGLLESELFGHEKGAFTSAVSQKIGRLEMADKGTLFLDEVGDIPLELQPKLLRVLQDQEFERLGGTKTIRVNVRIIAATNKDLERSVADHEYRSDLYYRLNVFPITAPPLRDRTGDIPLLVQHFVQKFSQRMGKKISYIPIATMNALCNWHWRGNIRELENFIERSVILSHDDTLHVAFPELRNTDHRMPGEGTLESMQREHIVRALRESGGVIAGLNGAAARLGLKRTTLQSRMQKMGIDRQEYEN